MGQSELLGIEICSADVPMVPVATAAANLASILTRNVRGLVTTPAAITHFPIRADEAHHGDMAWAYPHIRKAVSTPPGTL
jgi:hypothetical protein